MIGEGAFGKVAKVLMKESGEICAMKLLPRRRIEKEGIARYASAERNILADSTEVRHPFIVALRCAFQTPSALVLVMEYCPGGDLAGLLKRSKMLPVSLSRLYCAELLLALVHLHGAHVLHRDLKPENVLLDATGHVRLTDFGLSKERSDEGPNHSFLGSTDYMTPEVLAGHSQDSTVDIYCLGALLFAMLTGRPPFWSPSRNKMWADVRKANLMVPSDKVPTEASDLLKRVLRKKPAERLGFGDTRLVQEHAFFATIDFDALFRRQVPLPDLPDTVVLRSDVGGASLAGAPPGRRARSSTTERGVRLREELFGREQQPRSPRLFQCLSHHRQRTPDWDFDGRGILRELAQPVGPTLLGRAGPPDGAASKATKHNSVR